MNATQRYRARKRGEDIPAQTRGPARMNMAGQRYTRWVVIKPAKDSKDGQARWLCNCDCGTIGVVLGAKLRSGLSKSCGCLQREVAKSFAKPGRRSHEYKVWISAKQRCYNPHTRYFKDYGGRGITMSDEWRNSFDAFFRDMGPRPAETFIERNDNNLGYSKENCKWATQKQQMRNTRRNHMLTLGGETMCLTDWANQIGIHPNTLRHRISKGWAPERLLNPKLT